MLFNLRKYLPMKILVTNASGKENLSTLGLDSSNKIFHEFKKL